MIITTNTNTGRLATVTVAGYIVGVHSSAARATVQAKKVEREQGYRNNIACKWMDAEAVAKNLVSNIKDYDGAERQLIGRWIRRGYFQ